jgi:hypothetical protein
MASTFGALPRNLISLTARYLRLIATSATYSSSAILTMLKPLQLLTVTRIGPHVSKYIAPLVDFASILLVAQLLIKQNSNRWSLSPPLTRNSWPHVTFAACHCWLAASFGAFIFPQKAATTVYEDNNGCTTMGNAQNPTARTRHIDLKYFALCEWVERDLIHLELIDTSINIADHLTKLLSQVLFHWHTNFLLDHVPPKYSPVYQHALLHTLTTLRRTLIVSYLILLQPP